MGLAKVSPDISVAYKGWVPTGSDVRESLAEEIGVTSSFIASNNLLGEDFDEQWQLAQKHAPELFTGAAIRDEHKYQRTKEYLEEAQNRPKGLPSNAMYDIMWRNMPDLKERFPDAGFRDVDEIYETGGERLKEIKEKADFDYKHSSSLGGTLGYIGGTVQGFASDPVFMATMFVNPASKGATILNGAVRTGLFEAGVESLAQASNWQFKKDIGVDPSFYEALESVATVGLFSTVLYGGGAVIIKGIESRIKTGEVMDTPEVRDQIDQIKAMDEVLSDLDTIDSNDALARVNELKSGFDAITNGETINGSQIMADTRLRQFDAVDADIDKINTRIDSVASERNQLLSAISTRANDVSRIVELEELTKSKLSRSEKKALQKEIQATIKEGDEVQARIQARMDANYDLMAETNPQAYKKSIESENVRNRELRRPIEERMAALEARYDAAQEASTAEKELRNLNKKLSTESYDEAAINARITEIDSEASGLDDELFGLQVERQDLSAQPKQPEDIKAIDDAIERDIAAMGLKQDDTVAPRITPDGTKAKVRPKSKAERGVESAAAPAARGEGELIDAVDAEEAMADIISEAKGIADGIEGDIEIPFIDEHGNEVMRSAKEVLAGLDDEINGIDIVMEYCK